MAQEPDWEFEQVPFGPQAHDFASNPEARCPVVLLLDNSGSMSGEPINELNQGLRDLAEALRQDELAAKRCELAIVSFGPVSVVNDFTTADQWYPPTLTPAADTPLGAAVDQGLALIRERKAVLKANGVSYYRPWMFLITDGAPTDRWEAAATRLREEEGARKLAFFAVGVSNADMGVLSRLGLRSPLRLRGLAFRELFQWLSSSLQAVSHSSPSDQQLLLPPTQGWTTL